MSPSGELTRRQLLWRLTASMSAIALVGCQSDEPVVQGSPEVTSTPKPTPTPTSKPPATQTTKELEPLPATKRWRALPAEVSPAAKLQAARLVEVGCAWASDEAGVPAARQRLADSGFDPDLVKGLRPLLGPGVEAVVEVANAQYGGILSSSASVLLIVNQWVRQEDGRIRPGGTSLDVRLARSGPHWEVTAVRPAHPAPAADPLSALARRVLTERHIGLPYAAFRDVESGQVSDSVLRAMLGLAADFRYEVSVLKSGHPIQVFGTDRRSNHTDGNAVDVWAIDGRAVIDRRGRDQVMAFMQAAAREGAYQVGGPVNIDDGGTQYFSDLTHQDHVHIGFLS